MTNNKTTPIGKSGSAVALSQVGLMAFNFFYTIIVVRILSKPEYAVVAVLDIMITIFGFSEMGLLEVAGQQATSDLRKGRDESRAVSLIKCVVRYRTIVLVIMGIVAVFLAPYISKLFLKSTEYTWAIIILIPGTIARILYETLLGIGRITDNFLAIAQWDFIGGILRIALSLLAIPLFGFEGFLVGIVLSILISVIGLGWKLRRYIFNNIKSAPFLPTFKYGFPFYVRSFFRFGYLNYDQLIVGALLTPAALAGYTVAKRFTKFIFLIIESFQHPITYRMAEIRQEPEDEQGAFFKKATRYITLIVVPMTIIIVLISPWLMEILGGVKYQGDWPLLALMSLAQAAYAFYALYAGVIFSRFLPRDSLVLDGVVGGINFIAAPLLIIAFGKFGVAWGQIIGFLIGIILAIYMMRNMAHFKFDLTSIKLLVLPLLAAGSIIVLGQVAYPRIWSIPVYAIFGGIVFILLMGRQLTSPDWDQIYLTMPRFMQPLVRKIRFFFSTMSSKDQE